MRRLVKAEKKIRVQAEVPEWQKRSEEIEILLKMLDVHRRKREMDEADLSPEERAAKHELERQEENKDLQEWWQSNPYRDKPKVYDPVRGGWFLPPEEEEWLKKHVDVESDVAECRLWLASEEHQQFEKAYDDFKQLQDKQHQGCQG